MLVEGASVAPSVPVQTIGTATGLPLPTLREIRRTFSAAVFCVTHERPPLNRFRLGSPHIRTRRQVRIEEVRAQTIPLFQACLIISSAF